MSSTETFPGMVWLSTVCVVSPSVCVFISVWGCAGNAQVKASAFEQCTSKIYGKVFAKVCFKPLEVSVHTQNCTRTVRESRHANV